MIAPSGEPVAAKEIPIPAAITRKIPQKNESPIPDIGPINDALTAVIELASKCSSSLFCFSIEATNPIMKLLICIVALNQVVWRTIASARSSFV